MVSRTTMKIHNETEKMCTVKTIKTVVPMHSGGTFSSVESQVQLRLHWAWTFRNPCKPGPESRLSDNSNKNQGIDRSSLLGT